MLMKNKVSELLFGAKINNYCSINVNGMVAVVEEMGGISITFEDDYSYINPAYTIGATVTMDGAAVNTFVRYRDAKLIAIMRGKDHLDKLKTYIDDTFSYFDTNQPWNFYPSCQYGYDVVYSSEQYIEYYYCSECGTKN